jgi:hypothetical protein
MLRRSEMHSKVHKHVFAAEALPQTLLGELATLARTPFYRSGRGLLLPKSHPRTPSASKQLKPNQLYIRSFPIIL